MSLGKTETQYSTLELTEPFQLEHGGRLAEITVAYERYGTLNDACDNVVLICPTLTSDAHAAGFHDPDDPKTVGWWDSLIGPGKAVDTNTYHVVCSNILGGCMGTTGPSSIDPATGKAYGVSFPKVTIKDVVNVQKAVLDQLGVARLAAVIGGSLGGMQALEWAIQYPDFVDKCVCIAAGVSVSPQALAFDIIARQGIEHDPNWNKGSYYGEKEQPAYGLARARQIGHVTYLSSASMQNKFGREEREGYAEHSETHFSSDFQVESYLDYQGRKFIDRFDANSYLYVTQMMDLFDLEKEHGSIRKAVGKITSRVLLVGISSDWLFPVQQLLDIANALIAEKKDVSYFQIDSPYGHDAFLIEYDVLNKGVKAFLDGDASVEGTKELNNLDEFRELLKGRKGARLLDVGSGDGSLMQALARETGVTGICMDCCFDMVVACMEKGLNAVQLDADTALPLLEENAFDLIILSQTIQQLHSALQTLKQSVRVAPCSIVSFPNFAFYKCRLQLVFGGKLPVSKALPYEWYNSPNIHLVTLRDFRSLCERNEIEIADEKLLSNDGLGRLFIGLGFKNLGAERILVSLQRG